MAWRARLPRVLVALAAVAGLAWWAGEAREPGPPDDLSADRPADGSESAPVGVGDDSPAESTLLLARENRTAREPTGFGSIRVRVVRSPDSTPVPDVPVIARLPSTPVGQAGLIGWTDDRGIAVVEKLPVAADYDVRIQPLSQPPVEKHGVRVVDDDVTDLGTVVLKEIGLVDGLVLDSRREPLAGARVVATVDAGTVHAIDTDPWPLDPDPPFALHAITTDDRGRFRLEDVPPGLVAVRVTAPGFRGMTDRVLVPAQPPKSAWVVFVLRQDHAFVGRVVDGEHHALPNVLVEAGISGVDSFEPRLEARTDADGAFELRGFADIGTVDLRATAPSGAIYQFRACPQDRPLVLELRTGVKIFLAVEDQGSHQRIPGVRVTAAFDSEVVPGAEQARDPSTRRDTRVRATLVRTTDPEGNVLLEVGPGGVDLVEISHPDARTASVIGGRPVRCLLTGDLTRRFDRGETRSLVVSLRRGVALKVTVVDPRRTALESVPVRLVQAGDKSPVVKRTDAKGEALFEGVIPERSPVIEALSPTGTVLATTMPRFKPKEFPALAQLIVAPGARISGVVLGLDDVPQPGVRVRVAGSGPEARTDMEGKFVLEEIATNLPDKASRKVALVAEAAGIGEATTDYLEVRSGEALDGIKMNLFTGGEIRGVVLDLEGNRVHFPWVELRPSVGDETLRSVAAGEFGDFIFRAVRPGSYRLRAFGRGYGGSRPEAVGVGRGPGAVARFEEIRVGRLFPLEVVALDAQGARLPQVRLELRVGSSPAWAGGEFDVRKGVTGPDGTFRFETAAKPTSVVAKSGGRDPREVEVDVPQGTQSVEVRLSPKSPPK